MNLLDQLDTCLAALDRLHYRQHRAQIDAYCQRIACLLDAATGAFERLDSPTEERIVHADDAHHRELRRWASRVATAIDDLVLMLRAAVRARCRAAPYANIAPD